VSALALASVPGGARRSGLSLVKRWLRHTLFPETRKARLPLQGLPAGVGDIHAGGAALLLCADTDSRERLLTTICRLLEAGLAEQRVTWLCAASKAPLFMEAEIRNVVRDEQLRVLTWSEDAAAQVRELGPTHLLRELLSSGMSPRDLLIVDLIEPWMAETPEGAALEAGIVQAMGCLASWSKEHRGPILALAPTHRRGQALLPLVARSKVSRLASLQVQGSGARLDVVRWGAAHRPGPENLGARIALDIPAGGNWPQREATTFELRPALTAADASTVHAMRGALHDAGATPAGWHSYTSLEALLATAGTAVGATVVLAYDHPTSLPILANVIGRLRHEHPHLLRILVRETGAAMRHNGELALTRLGANAVVRRELSFAQLEQVIEDLRDETYARKPAANPARLLQRLAPDPVQGYLAPLAFCAAVERMLERTAETPLEHTLVHLPLLPHISHADALQACAPRRDGDLVSANDRGLYIFLFGCPADDAMAALDSVFALPCSELAHHVQIDHEHHTQRRALLDLRRHNESAPANYGAARPGLRHGAAEGDKSAAMQAVALPTRTPEPVRRVQTHVLPLRAATV
jgi:cellulose biosynthesis protein BcsE